jgi:predicted secreted Zn-dependent protease
VLGALLAGSLSVAALADVRTTTQSRAYSVNGSTASSLVSFMRSNPFRGDTGDAVANVRPYYTLNVATKATGGTCRASGVTLNIRFVMTLPHARSISAMASSTRSAWNSFVAFTRRHEDTHRRLYIQCGNSFVAKAQRLTASSCGAVQASIRRLLEAEKRACDSRQRAFDRADYGRINGLSLFQMARGSSRARR